MCPGEAQRIEQDTKPQKKGKNAFYIRKRSVKPIPSPCSRTTDRCPAACCIPDPVEDVREGEALGLAKYIHAPGKGTTIVQVLYGFYRGP